MKRAILKKVVLFFFVKYVLFYILMMFKNNDFSLIQLNRLRNSGDLFYYCWTFLFYPILCIVLFSLPIYYAIKSKKIIYFIPLLSLVLVTEYTIYTYLDSQLDLMNGVYNGGISLVVFILVFYKQIRLILNQSKRQ